MTTTFWLIAGVFIALALAFIAYPMFARKTRNSADTDIRNQNLIAYSTRMAELDAEYAAGGLEKANYQQLRDELAGSMLDDVGEAEQPCSRTTGRHRAGPLAVVLFSVVSVPAASVYLYQKWGAMDEIEQWQTMQEMSASEGSRVARMKDLTAELRSRLEASPANPEGWAMLGRTYMRLEEYRDAAWAFEKLAGLVENEEPASQAVAWGLAAQAWFFDSRGAMNQQVTAAIEKARSLDPDEVNALGLLGIHAFGQDNYEDAIKYWERIAEVAPDHPQLPAIREGIAQAYKRLGREAPVAQPTMDIGPEGVTVRVELAEAFAGQVPGETALFIFARRPGDAGGPPLAVARLTAADLPTEIRLDDRFAMAPTARISQAEEVLILARLSRSGTAMPQAGDWQGELTEPVEVSAAAGEATILVIDQQLHN